MQQLAAELKALPKPYMVYAVVSEEKPSAIKVQRRGNPEDEAEPVTPGTFAWVSHAGNSFRFGRNARGATTTGARRLDRRSEQSANGARHRQSSFGIIISDKARYYAERLWSRWREA